MLMMANLCLQSYKMLLWSATIKKRLLIYLLIVSIFFIILYNSKIQSSSKAIQQVNSSRVYRSSHQVTKLIKSTVRKRILIYTPLFGSIPWRYVPYSYDFRDFDGKPCQVDQCDLTYNKDDLPRSDLVVFHGRDIPSAEHLRSISSLKRPQNQSWLYFIHESPINTYTDLHLYRGIFNWTASYKNDADILATYHYYRPLSGEDKRPDPNHNFAKGKKGLISYLNSHCDNDRMTFIRELRKHIQVDVYGGCSRQFKPQTRPCPRNKICEEIQKEYKFHLALENSYCKDYITEKYWLNSLNLGIVPIVLGGGDYSNPRLAIPGSYINAQDFNSLKDLTDHIKYLDKNDTAYNAFHEWRYKYILYEHNSFCVFCEAAHFYSSPRKTVDLEEFQGKHNCDLKLKALHKLAG